MTTANKKRGGKEPPDPKILKTFSTNLKSCIPTNEWLASRTGLSSQAIADYVNGVSLPRADFLSRISEAVDKQIDWLLTGKGPGLLEAHGGCVPDCPLADRDPVMIDQCKKVKNVIKSGPPYSDALRINIDSFHHAVETERQSKQDLQELRDEIKRTNKRLNDLQSQQDKHRKQVSDATIAPPTGTDEEDGTQR